MKISDYIKTSVLVTIVFFLTVQKGSCFLLVLLLPFFLMAVTYNLVRMIRRPGERKGRGIRLAIWTMTLALAGTVQVYWSVATRTDAESALQKVLTHKEHTGTYPVSLKEVGLDDTYLKDTRKLRYSVREGKPALTYPAPFMPLALYEYDFETLTWRQNAY